MNVLVDFVMEARRNVWKQRKLFDMPPYSAAVLASSSSSSSIRGVAKTAVGADFGGAGASAASSAEKYKRQSAFVNPTQVNLCVLTLDNGSNFL